MAMSKPVACLANDGRLLRVYPSLLEASRKLGDSTSTIREYMKDPDKPYRKPTLQDLKENYLFERSIGEVNNELAWMMKQMMDEEEK